MWRAVHLHLNLFYFFKSCFLSFFSSSKEKAMATHSSTLAWKIPWAEEPGRLLSMGLHRVGHDWSDLAAVAAAKGTKSKVRALLTQLQQSFQLAIKCDTVFFSTFQKFGMNFGHIPSLPGEMLAYKPQHLFFF